MNKKFTLILGAIPPNPRKIKKNHHNNIGIFHRWSIKKKYGSNIFRVLKYEIADLNFSKFTRFALIFQFFRSLDPKFLDGYQMELLGVRAKNEQKFAEFMALFRPICVQVAPVAVPGHAVFGNFPPVSLSLQFYFRNF